METDYQLHQRKLVLRLVSQNEPMPGHFLREAGVVKHPIEQAERLVAGGWLGKDPLARYVLTERGRAWLVTRT